MWRPVTCRLIQPGRACDNAVCIERKPWLFSDTPKGATASAKIYSLVETAKVNGQEPYTWLRHVLEQLPHASSVEDYEALLPWNCSPEMPR